jgi:hypothetical protein
VRRAGFALLASLALAGATACGVVVESTTTATQVVTQAVPVVAAAGSGAQAAPLSGHAASKLFGRFTYRINGDGTITQDARWVRRYIAQGRVPILGTVRCHRMLFPQLTRALAEVERAGLAQLIDLDDFRRMGGCWVARQQLWDPTKPLSMHAWGLAIDFNVARNQYGATPRMDPRIVAIFERWGFRWGGRWSPPDGMHFELGALVRA